MQVLDSPRGEPVLTDPLTGWSSKTRSGERVEPAYEAPSTPLSGGGNLWGVSEVYDQRADELGAADWLTGDKGKETDGAPGGSGAVRYENGAPDEGTYAPDAADETLDQRLGALRELIGLSRTRLEAETLAEAGRVLDGATARRGLTRAYTTVALAGATGSGKSSLFNTLTGSWFAEVGVRRPTTAAPVACTWEVEDADGADGLLDRLGLPQHARHRARDDAFSGMVLIDLPDHDSVAPGHREQVDRMLELVDAVVWVVDPEKYADAVLHERYLRQLAGHAEVTFVVLNQTDRLTRDAVDAVLEDLRRLLDEDGMALGEHGEPGAAVLAASALTEEGVGQLREDLGEFIAGRRASVLRLSADLDGAMERLRPVYADPGPGAMYGPAGLTDIARQDFEDRLAVAVGAAAAGHAAERAWLRRAQEASGTPWVRMLRWYVSRVTPETDAPSQETASRAGSLEPRPWETLQQPLAARPVVAQAVRDLADAAASGLPGPWARTVRDAARRGAAGLPEALDKVIEESAGPLTTTWRGGAKTERGARAGAERLDGSGEAASGDAADGEESENPAPENSHSVHDESAGARAPGGERANTRESKRGRKRAGRARPARPSWHIAALAGQWLLFTPQVAGALWLLTLMITGRALNTMLVPFAVLVAGTVGGPLLAWGCRAAARGPARTYGLEEERRLRESAAACGRTRVLEPVAAELMRYREVREQYAIAAGAVGRNVHGAAGVVGAAGAAGTFNELDVRDALGGPDMRGPADEVGPADGLDAADLPDAADRAVVPGADSADGAEGTIPAGAGHSRE
ncbi:GTPase [Streptomyces axinellae]|uniref:G domain-containing protein n=1 Tax=Streptomyces axinellae TaxID=552788 RepID=A0ABN3PRK9_9ACTN